MPTKVELKPEQMYPNAHFLYQKGKVTTPSTMVTEIATRCYVTRIET